MEHIIQKHFRMTMLSAGFLIIIGALAVFLGAGALMLHTSLSGQIEGWEGAVRKYVEAYGADPDIDSAQRQELMQWAQQTQQEFAATCTPLADQTLRHELSPLVFKQRLFSVQDELRHQAAAQGVGMPQALGFEQYGLEVPAAQMLPRLHGELLVLEDLVGRLIASRISRITALSFARDAASVPQEKPRVIDGLPLEEYAVHVSFEADVNAVRQCLESLAQAKPCYVVQGLTLTRDAAHAGMVTVSLDVVYIGWSAHEELG